MLLGVLVLIIVLLVWLLSTLLGNNTSDTSGTPATPSEETSSVSVNPSWTDTAWGTPTPTPTPSGSSASTPGSAPASSAASGASSASKTPTPSASSTPATVACSAGSASVGLTGGSSSVKVGAKVAFTVTLTNTGKTDCTWDFAKLPVGVTVTSGSDRIWSSDDCAAWKPRGKTTVRAGKSYPYKVTWPGQRSTENSCKASTEELGAGYYVATAEIKGGATKKFVMQLHQ